MTSGLRGPDVGGGMSGDFISLRMLVVSGASADRDLWRQGAALGSVPIEIAEASDVKTGCDVLQRGGIDIVVLDSALSNAAEVIKCAQALTPSPFVIAAAPASGGKVEGADGVVAKPANSEEARKQVERCIRVKVPTRILIVDDSGTMRSIVRKILSASRYALDISDAAEGAAALQQIKGGTVDIVLLDYNMPGLNGVETLREIKRETPRVAVVMMTSAVDDDVAEQARVSGAAAFLKKPFYPKDIDTILERYYGLSSPKR